MAIYVDELFDYPRKGQWCHMATDGDDLDELHEMADKIGLKRSWFQPKSSPHYDLRPSKRELAIKHGAIPVSRQTLVITCVLPRKQKSTR